MTVSDRPLYVPLIAPMCDSEAKTTRVYWRKRHAEVHGLDNAFEDDPRPLAVCHGQSVEEYRAGLYVSAIRHEFDRGRRYREVYRSRMKVVRARTARGLEIEKSDEFKASGHWLKDAIHDCVKCTRRLIEMAGGEGIDIKVRWGEL